MNALRLDPSGPDFSRFYEPRRGPLFSRKTLIAVGLTAVCYGGLGAYLVTQKYEITPFETPIENTPITMQKLPETPPETKSSTAKTVTARRVDTPAKSADTTLPLTASDKPATDDMPTEIGPSDPVIDTPVGPVRPVIAAPGVIRNPVWISRPTPEQVGMLYPERAAEMGMTGTATLLCGIRANGTMTGCQVLDETPSGMRFGAAALAMARYFRISPKTVDDQPVDGFKVRIPIVFSLAN